MDRYEWHLRHLVVTHAQRHVKCCARKKHLWHVGVYLVPWYFILRFVDFVRWVTWTWPRSRRRFNGELCYGQTPLFPFCCILLIDWYQNETITAWHWWNVSIYETLSTIRCKQNFDHDYLYRIKKQWRWRSKRWLICASHMESTPCSQCWICFNCLSIWSTSPWSID